VQVVSSTEAPMTASEAWDAAVEACGGIISCKLVEQRVVAKTVDTVLNEIGEEIDELKGRCPDALSGESK